MNVPGATAIHTVISDACRSTHGDMGAFDEAARRLRDEYEKCLEGWKDRKGVKFHIVLSVERPQEGQSE